MIRNMTKTQMTTIWLSVYAGFIVAAMFIIIGLDIFYGSP